MRNLKKNQVATVWPPCGHCVATVWPPCGHRWHSICVRLVACTLALWLSCLPALLLACLPDRGHFARWLAYLPACLPTCLAQQAQQARRPTRWQRGVEQPMKMTMIPAIMTCGGWLPRATNEKNHDTCEYDGRWYAQRLGEAVAVYAPLSRVPCRGPVSCKLRSELGFRTSVTMKKLELSSFAACGLSYLLHITLQLCGSMRVRISPSGGQAQTKRHLSNTLLCSGSSKHLPAKGRAAPVKKVCANVLHT